MGPHSYADKHEIISLVTLHPLIAYDLHRKSVNQSVMLEERESRTEALYPEIFLNHTPFFIFNITL